jgi:hypothetical protein
MRKALLLMLCMAGFAHATEPAAVPDIYFVAEHKAGSQGYGAAAANHH